MAVRGRTETPVLPGRGRRILVVDDDPIIRKLIVAVARAVGCTTSEVADGKDAVALIEQRRFDLVILDLMLPTLSGHDVLDRLDPELGCSVLVVTASDDHDIGKLDSELICGIVRKPFDIHHLASVIARAVGIDPPANGIGSGARLPVRQPGDRLDVGPSPPKMAEPGDDSPAASPSMPAEADDDA